MSARVNWQCGRYSVMQVELVAEMNLSMKVQVVETGDQLSMMPSQRLKKLLIPKRLLTQRNKKWQLAPTKGTLLKWLRRKSLKRRKWLWKSMRKCYKRRGKRWWL